MVEKYPGQVNVVYKNFPLRNHKMARPASQAALAANIQGKFWEYHDKIFANYSSLSEEKFQQFAIELGLDLDRFNKDRKSQQIQQKITDDLRLGQRVGVRGTPTVFIDGQLLKKRDPKNASAMIEKALVRAKNK